MGTAKRKPQKTIWIFTYTRMMKSSLFMTLKTAFKWTVNIVQILHSRVCFTDGFNLPGFNYIFVQSANHILLLLIYCVPDWNTELLKRNTWLNDNWKISKVEIFLSQFALVSSINQIKIPKYHENVVQFPSLFSICSNDDSKVFSSSTLIII